MSYINNLDENIIPLSDSNYWVYTNHYYSISLPDTIFEAVPVKFLLGDKIILNNEVWYPFSYTYPFFPFYYAATNRVDGLWAVDYKGNKLNKIDIDSSWLFFKYPTKIGDKWYNKYFHDSICTLALDTVIHVPAGSFKCIHYQGISFCKYPNSGYFVSPSIGLIKCDIYMGANMHYSVPDSGWNILELKEYRIPFQKY